MAYLRWLISTLPVSAGLMAAPGCIIADPNHCANSDEPCLAAQVCDPCTPSSQTPAVNGCVATAEAVDQDPGQAGCQLDGVSTDTPTTQGTATTTVDESTTGDETSPQPDTTVSTDPDTTTTSGAGCDDCGGSTPYCDEGTGMCVGCEALPDTFCAGLDEATPACNPDTGSCQLCTAEEASACSGDTPACIDDTCVACFEHAQCPDSACNLDVGSCMPTDAVVYVDNTFADCGSGDGSLKMPLCTIGAGISAVGELGTVRVFPGNYAPPVNIVTGQTVAIMGWTGEPTVEPGNAGDPEIVRVLNSTAYFAGMHFVGDGGVGANLRCNNSSLWVDDSRLTGNDADQGVAISGDACAPLWVRRSEIVGNRGGGIDADTSESHIVNCFIRGNGFPGVSNVSGLRFEQGNFEVLYTSIAFNSSSGADGIICDEFTLGTIRNSAVVSPTPGTIGCTAEVASVTYTGTDDMNFIGGTGNVEIDGSVFVSTNDLHTTAGSALEGVAQWQAGGAVEDPRTDIEGDARPTVDRSMDYAGADVP